MKNKNWIGKKKVHEWDFMGHSKDGVKEFCLCQHCGKLGFWVKDISDFTEVKQKEYDDMVDKGEIIFD